VKLVVAIVQDDDALRVLRALVERGHRATRIASTGGFLAAGNSTLLIATEEAEVDAILDIVRNECPRDQVGTDPTGGAVMIVVPVERFERA
jgi:uncharacterized protein YaaQ